MGTQPILDVDGLLSPIAGAAPCGSDPRLDPSPLSPYQNLKDARRAAADSERNLELGFGEESDASNAEATLKKSWNLIFAEGPALIASVAKDLEVSAWLIEALVRLHRLAGLRDGLLLTAGLVERYWDGIFPLPDEDGLETRLIPLAALSGYDVDGRLIDPLKKVPLTEGDAPIAFWQHQALMEGRPGAAPIDLAAGIRRSSPQFVRDLADDGRDCLDALAKLEAALEARCAAEVPSFSRLRDVLAAIVDAVKTYGAAMLHDDDVTVEPVPAAEETALAAMAAAGEPAPAIPTQRPLDRQAAFRQLEELALFFRRTEPHSPIAYAIDNLVRRGRMSFPELIEELINDGNARRDYFVNAGIQPPPDGPKGS